MMPGRKRTVALLLRVGLPSAISEIEAVPSSTPVAPPVVLASTVTSGGAVTFGGVVSSTVTFWVAVAVLPEASVPV